jgi:ABC-type transporter Mla MlaB component
MISTSNPEKDKITAKLEGRLDIQSICEIKDNLFAALNSCKIMEICHSNIEEVDMTYLQLLQVVQNNTSVEIIIKSDNNNVLYSAARQAGFYSLNFVQEGELNHE